MESRVVWHVQHTRKVHPHGKKLYISRRADGGGRPQAIGFDSPINRLALSLPEETRAIQHQQWLSLQREVLKNNVRGSTDLKRSQDTKYVGGDKLFSLLQREPHRFNSVCEKEWDESMPLA